MTSDRPLAGVRVIDAVRGPLAVTTRYLAELGASVTRVVPAPPDDLDDLVANLGKDFAGGASLTSEIGSAHAVVADRDFPIDLAAARDAHPSLVTMTVSDFGSDTRFAGWQATDAVLHALSGELSRSGIRGREPLLPPGTLAFQCAAAQAAFALASALYLSLATDVGDHIEFSALDGAVQALDPGYGISGSATMGRPAHLLSRDRPAIGFQYPILRCADGYVRICLLARRQWRGMFTWMGEPSAFASPEFDKTVFRYRSPDLLPAIAAFFAPRTRSDLEAEGQRHGVPIAAVLTYEESIATDHVRERRALVPVALEGGDEIMLPNGIVTIDGVRMGSRSAATAPADFAWPPAQPRRTLPFEGLRVLDLGVIVVGAEQGRLLADGGADVVKVESRDYPDGNRQSHLSYGLSVSFAAGHRNKRSLGINLREAAGRALFLDLAATADIVLSNFKPGTMASLGLDRATLAAVNPRLVVVESSAFGDTGPWSGRMGYGPLVRAATGLTLAWRYPGDPEGFCDSVTIYPDHVAARVGALAVVSLLIRRLRTGRGGAASVAQAEVLFSHFGADVARAARGEPAGGKRDWPWGVYRAAGDDEWCVITVRDDDDWGRLAAVIGFANTGDTTTPSGRLAARDWIDATLVPWVAARSAEEVMHRLQAAGVPAARMLRVADLPSFAYYRERGFFRTEEHPYLQEDVIAERWAVKRRDGVDAAARPAPLMGEHSRAVVAEWLGATIDPDTLAAAGVLEPADPAVLAAAIAGGSRAAAEHSLPSR